MNRSKTTRTKCWALLTALVLTATLLSAHSARAVTLIFEAEVGGLMVGTDPAGLVGAQLTLEIDLAGQAYLFDSDFSVLAEATRTTLTVTGASEASSNGTFSSLSPAGVLLIADDRFARVEAYFVIADAASNGRDRVVFDLPLVDLGFALAEDQNIPLPIPSPGDPIRIDDFPDSISSQGTFSSTDRTGAFFLLNRRFTVIPEPTSAALLGLGGLLLARRRRRPETADA